MTEQINILGYTPNVRDILGPGNRFALWTQGCPFNCKNCTTPEGIPIKPNRLLKIEEMTKIILEQKNIDGITISGGEPFLQASKLHLLLNAVKQYMPLINVIVYSGFKHNKLSWQEAKDFLSHIDLFIDGLFDEKLNDNKGIRGSTNQNFIYLTDKLKPYKEQIENGERNYQHSIEGNYSSTIGIPQKIKL